MKVQASTHDIKTMCNQMKQNGQKVIIRRNGADCFKADLMNKTPQGDAIVFSTAATCCRTRKAAFTRLAEIFKIKSAN